MSDGRKKYFKNLGKKITDKSSAMLKKIRQEIHFAYMGYPSWVKECKRLRIKDERYHYNRKEIYTKEAIGSTFLLQ